MHNKAALVDAPTVTVVNSILIGFQYRSDKAKYSGPPSAILFQRTLRAGGGGSGACPGQGTEVMLGLGIVAQFWLWLLLSDSW